MFFGAFKSRSLYFPGIDGNSILSTYDSSFNISINIFFTSSVILIMLSMSVLKLSTSGTTVTSDFYYSVNFHKTSFSIFSISHGKIRLSIYDINGF